jgi:L-amino acid N-acyltransferase YncA
VSCNRSRFRSASCCAACARLTSRPLEQFIAGLSPASRRARFHGAVRGFDATHLAALVNADGHSRAALVGSVGSRLVAVAEYVADAQRHAAEVALVVSDDWQRRSVGLAMMASLRARAAVAGLPELYGHVRHDNLAMLGLMRRAGFRSAGWLGEPGTLVLCARVDSLCTGVRHAA